MRKIVNHLAGQGETSPSCKGSYQDTSGITSLAYITRDSLKI